MSLQPQHLYPKPSVCDSADMVDRDYCMAQAPDRNITVDEGLPVG